jgi:hypothetical protein
MKKDQKIITLLNSHNIDYHTIELWIIYNDGTTLIKECEKPIEDFLMDQYSYHQMFVSAINYNINDQIVSLYEFDLPQFIIDNLSLYNIMPEDQLHQFKIDFIKNQNNIISGLLYRMWYGRFTLNEVLNQYLRQETYNNSWKQYHRCYNYSIDKIILE